MSKNKCMKDQLKLVPLGMTHLYLKVTSEVLYNHKRKVFFCLIPSFT